MLPPPPTPVIPFSFATLTPFNSIFTVYIKSSSSICPLTIGIFKGTTLGGSLFSNQVLLQPIIYICGSDSCLSLMYPISLVRPLSWAPGWYFKLPTGILLIFLSMSNAKSQCLNAFFHFSATCTPSLIPPISALVVCGTCDHPLVCSKLLSPAGDCSLTDSS